jgi:hypothetical protein
MLSRHHDFSARSFAVANARDCIRIRHCRLKLGDARCDPAGFKAEPPGNLVSLVRGWPL